MSSPARPFVRLSIRIPLSLGVAAACALGAGSCTKAPPALAVGLMTDLFGDPTKLRYAMAIQAAVVGVLALAIVALGMGAYRRCVEELERLLGAGAGTGIGAGRSEGVVAATAAPGVSR